MRNRVIPLLVLVLLSVSFVSAYSNGVDYKERITKTNYYPDDGYSITHTIYSDYDNEDRYSTRDYRNGYSYRTSRPYWDDHRFDDRADYREEPDYRRTYDRRDYDRYDRYDRDYRYRDDDYYRGARKDYYYKYISYLDEYERIDCYHDAPRDQLFYIRCP